MRAESSRDKKFRCVEMCQNLEALLGLKPLSGEREKPGERAAVGKEFARRNLRKQILRGRGGLCMVLNVVAGARRHNEDESLVSYD
jgi:hypothetical protein